MIPFSVTIKQSRPPEIMQREFNGMVRAALLQVGIYWVKHFLPKHFEPGAVQRYSYTARKPKYNAKKYKAELLKLPSGAKVRNPNFGQRQACPLVYTGEWRKLTLAKTPGDFNYKLTSTATKTMVRVPVPIPHPIPVKYANEIGRLTTDEMRTLHRVASEWLKMELSRWRAPRTTKIAA